MAFNMSTSGSVGLNGLTTLSMALAKAALLQSMRERENGKRTNYKIENNNPHSN